MFLFFFSYRFACDVLGMGLQTVLEKKSNGKVSPYAESLCYGLLRAGWAGKGGGGVRLHTDLMRGEVRTWSVQG